MIYAYSALGVQAVVPILLGAFASVKTPRSIRQTIKAAHLERAAKTANGNADSRIPHPDEIYYALLGEEDPEDDEEEDEDKVGLQDSLWFPVMASCALFGFFLLFKFVDPIWINRIISTYFAGASVLAIQMVSKIIDPLLDLDFVVLPLALSLPPLYIYLGKPWYITNVLSFCFAYSAIKAMKLDGFLTGAALLAGLFVYDIFWVFGTPVMENVAKSLDAPIKVLAPRDISDWSAGFTMLGLGDIVLPGVFISLALRYDFANHVRRQLKADKTNTPTRRDRYSKPYFFAVLVAYVLGLVTTVVVMHRFKAAQPALLYLSPACIGSIALTAWLRQEFSQTTSWKDEDPVEAGKEKKSDNAPDSLSSEEESNVDSVLTSALIARAATCAYLYFAHAKLFPASTTQSFDTSAAILLQNSSVIDAKSSLQYFLRWDALYYVKLAMEGYRYEQELAFLPGWPLCMRAGGEVVRFIRNSKASSSGAANLDVFDVLVSGIVLANVLSIAAAVAFYKLTSRVTDNKTFALYSSYLYVLTTSTATASSPYTEPLFAFLTCTGFFFVLPSRISKRTGSKLVLTKILGILLLAAASSTRSLGLLNTAVVLVQGLLDPIARGDRRFFVSRPGLHRLCAFILPRMRSPLSNSPPLNGLS
ncbi:hypothetical protein QFC22_006438 [Naganishia vaughanmartiniae]|uniref:Uncharacterized protein n=1 Tax=Naganishia vaughanmartiniae TaxID=1424756 RepID=A0ACC2WKV4_9TREE|nr:hypothetical protein QFC22_006438 [Naganishia vaughanmartiniae]